VTPSAARRVSHQGNRRIEAEDVGMEITLMRLVVVPSRFIVETGK
jgi:hypothetical protein